MTDAEQINIDDLAKDEVCKIASALENNSSGRSRQTDTWLTTLKQIITAADLHRTNQQDIPVTNEPKGDCIFTQSEDVSEQLNNMSEQFATNNVKWTIRVSAFKLVHKIMHQMSTQANKDLSQVKKHLPDMVRLAFVAATSPYDDLKLQGFEMFKFLVLRLSTVEEPEFPGHSILEQYKTQYQTALKPAFSSDAPPYITSIACQVLSLWLCKGLEKSSLDLDRSFKLIIESITKLENQSNNNHSKLYTESELEQERICILGSWAQIYITAKESKSDIMKQLHELVEPQLARLDGGWLDALREYALLIMHAPRANVSVHDDNHHVYTKEVALKFYEPVWPKLLLAVTLRQCSKQESRNESENGMRLNFIYGIIMHQLINYIDSMTPNSRHSEAMIYALMSMLQLIKQKRVNDENIEIYAEFFIVLRRISRNTPDEASQLQHIVRLILQEMLEMFSALLNDNKDTCAFEKISRLRNDFANTENSKSQLRANESQAKIVAQDPKDNQKRNETKPSTRPKPKIALRSDFSNFATSAKSKKNP